MFHGFFRRDPTNYAVAKKYRVASPPHRFLKKAISFSPVFIFHNQALPLVLTLRHAGLDIKGSSPLASGLPVTLKCQVYPITASFICHEANHPTASSASSADPSLLDV